jgi:hypothetical protein
MTKRRPHEKLPFNDEDEGTTLSRLTILVGVSLLAAPASASTPAAWQKLEKQAQRGCIAASAFAQPKLSNMIIFDDATGVVALLVTGTYRQRHMKGAKGTSLCLYNRRTGKAAVEEATGWGERR